MLLMWKLNVLVLVNWIGENFKITNAKVNFSGASEVTMNVTNSLNGTLSGASDFAYVTKPTEFNLKSSGASEIHKK